MLYYLKHGLWNPKKKVQDIIKELSIPNLKIKEFVRFKIGE
jgi:elongation factor Ts